MQTSAAVPPKGQLSLPARRCVCVRFIVDGALRDRRCFCVVPRTAVTVSKAPLELMKQFARERVTSIRIRHDQGRPLCKERPALAFCLSYQLPSRLFWCAHTGKCRDCGRPDRFLAGPASPSSSRSSRINSTAWSSQQRSATVTDVDTSFGRRRGKAGDAFDWPIVAWKMDRQTSASTHRGRDGSTSCGVNEQNEHAVWFYLQVHFDIVTSGDLIRTRVLLFRD